MINNILSKFPIYKFRITMISEYPVELRSWNNSAIRGTFGNKLIEKFCTNNPVMTCETCNKASQCSACILYHTGTPNNSEQKTNPYIISCEDFVDNTELIFNFTIFSNGITTIKDIFTILEDGLPIGKNNTIFKLKSIEDYFTNQSIFDGFMWCIPNPYYIEHTLQECTSLTIEFITPYHIKGNLKNIDFEYIIRSSLRRISTLYRQSNVPICLDFKQIIQDTKNIKTVNKDIHLESYSRYSNRTHQSMNVMGYVGSISFKGDLTQFIPLLKLCEQINIGKLCVMGFGQIHCY